MANAASKPRTDPLEPSRDEADWSAQGWAAQAEPLSAASRLATTISVRFAPDAAFLLRQAARLSHQTRFEFVRQATIAAANKKITEAVSSVVIRRVFLASGDAVTSSIAPTIGPNPLASALSATGSRDDSILSIHST